MKPINRTICAILAALLFSTIFPGCINNSPNKPDSYIRITSLEDVPGITADEIKAIEKLREGGPFVFGALVSTEAFYSEDGEIRGYAALFCDWLSELFGVKFKLAIYEWGELIAGLEAQKIDFTGELTATEDRRKIYHMTDAIAERSIKYMRIMGSESLASIAAARPLRYAFLEDTTTFDSVSSHETRAFESVHIGDYETAYNLLKSGKIDAFFDEGSAEAAFDVYGDVVAADFFPLIYGPVSLTTKNPALAPVISVVQKVLQNNGIHYLTELYNIGHFEYVKHKMVMLLSREEQDYIRRNPVVRVAAEYDNYPLSFFNTYEKQWQGISHDLMREIETLTGLSFNIVNDQRAEWPVLLRMLETGNVSMISDLVQTEERKGLFLWPETEITTDYYALLSKSDHRNINVNEILFTKVGLIKDSAYAELFKSWFPKHANTVEYDSTELAFDALERGEVEMIMASNHDLLVMTNYRELPGYKANIVFNRSYESKFGFNKNEIILCSIIDKALQLIDVKWFAEQWIRKTYDYRVKLTRERTSWLISAALLFFVLIFVVVLFQRKRSAGKQLEILVNDRTSELKQALTKLKALISNYKGIIWSVDKEGVITTFNGQYLRVVGLESSLIEGKKLEAARQKNGHLDFIDNVEKTLHEHAGQDWISEINGDMFHSRTAPIYDGGGDIIGVVGSTDDVTETIKLQREMERAIFATQAASRAKSAFLANMSHEIRTPMNSIVGFSELALDDEIPPKTRGYLSKIKENSTWLLQIINDILDISKIESGKMELEIIPFKLNEVLTRCQTIISNKASEKGILLHFYAEPSISKMMLGDPTRLGQVLINILGNAVKFTNVGAIKLSATVRLATESRNTIHFEIRDSGIGMTPEQIDKIFEPFTQADSSTTRKYGGTGLGLTITKNIIELMGGQLKVESAQGIGSKFSFDLTFETADLLEDSSASGSDDVIEKPVFSGETILVCEDNNMNQIVIREHLSKVGLQTVIAENGQMGVDMVKRRMENGEPPFSLIFMDMHMPVMDGLEATSCIMQLGTGTPIVAMTANIMSGDRETYKSIGMKDYVGKPFTSQELWRCLLKYLKPAGEKAGASDAQRADRLLSSSQPAEEIRQTQEDDDLMLKLKNVFFNDNQHKLKEIAGAIGADDIKLAHRLAHTLKSNAGQLGETDLQKAAYDVEARLKDGKNLTTEEQVNTLAKELDKVLKELAPFVKAAPAHKAEAAAEPLDREKTRELLSALEPMLKEGNPECLNLVDSLRAIPESGELIRQIEDFDFEPAIFTLDELKKKAGL
jgi:PAS domain S-box-containing protein